jgi:protein HIRA/HIR1
VIRFKLESFNHVSIEFSDKPIFSVDISGNKFATGGQGNDCGRVVIWNLLPLLSEKQEMDKSIPKLLCQMDNHLGESALFS